MRELDELEEIRKQMRKELTENPKYKEMIQESGMRVLGSYIFWFYLARKIEDLKWVIENAERRDKERT